MMEFLKKHYEKVALAVILLVLMITGVVLAIKVGRLNAALDADANRPPGRGNQVEPLSLGAYANALQSLQSPPQWTTNTLFKGADSIVHTNTAKTSPDLLFMMLGPPRPEPFKLLFKTCSYDASKGEGYNFQVNFLSRSQTFFITHVGDPVKDQYEDTGYKVTGYTRKTRAEYNATTGSTNVVDQSELTVQHAGEGPILMTLGQVTLGKEPVATIRCDEALRPQAVRRGQTFACKNVSYNVVDMSLTQMIVVEVATGKRHEISFGVEGAGTPPAQKETKPQP